MRTKLRIVAGSLRGRNVICNVHPRLRPTPQMVREALFSMLGEGVPDRPFFDVFAGTGVIGLEALSRGASSVTFVERDLKNADAIARHLHEFGVAERGHIVRGDVYRWVERLKDPQVAANVFLSPPFADFEHRLPFLLKAIGEFQEKLAPESVLVVQSERTWDPTSLPLGNEWENRRYGRNELLIWVK